MTMSWGLALEVAQIVWMVGISAFILLERRSPAATLAWITVMAALPLVGFGIYLVLGPRRLTRKRLRFSLARKRIDRLMREWKDARATLLSLDYQGADTRYQIDPPDHLSPDKLFDRAWATTLLERVIFRLREESEAEGRAGQFEQLKGYLMVGTNNIPYAAAATALGMSEGTVRVAVHRLRRRYRELLQQEIIQTLADPAQADEEMRALMGAFSNG